VNFYSAFVLNVDISPDDETYFVGEFQDRSIESSQGLHVSDLAMLHYSQHDECRLCGSLSSTAGCPSSSPSAATVPCGLSDNSSQRQNFVDSVVLLPCLHRVCAGCLSAAVTGTLSRGSVLENCPVRNIVFTSLVSSHLT